MAQTIVAGLLTGAGFALLWIVMWTMAFPWGGYLPYIAPVFLLGAGVGALVSASSETPR